MEKIQLVILLLNKLVKKVTYNSYKSKNNLCSLDTELRLYTKENFLHYKNFNCNKYKLENVHGIEIELYTQIIYDGINNRNIN